MSPAATIAAMNHKPVLLQVIPRPSGGQTILILDQDGDAVEIADAVLDLRMQLTPTHWVVTLALLADVEFEGLVAIQGATPDVGSLLDGLDPKTIEQAIASAGFGKSPGGAVLDVVRRHLEP